ncbi:MAG: TatD family hydrolase [Candidatus Woesearchaeota archaeon]
MKFIDIHSHLDPYFYPDIDEVIKNLQRNNTIAIAAGINPETNKHVLKLSKKYPKLVYATLGLYPRDAFTEEEIKSTGFNVNFDVDKEIDFIYQNKDNIIGIGEVGMDFKNGKDLEMQEKDFRKIIELAIKINKPLIIHSRKAELKVIEILEEYSQKYNYEKIIMHCFTGNHNLVKKIRQNKWFFSIPTSIVRDMHFQKIVKETPLTQILTETDSPFLSPFKEKRNEPIFVKETIKTIAKLRNTPEEDVANLIYLNAKRVFEVEF